MPGSERHASNRATAQPRNAPERWARFRYTSQRNVYQHQPNTPLFMRSYLAWHTRGHEPLMCARSGQPRTNEPGNAQDTTLSPCPT